MEKSTQSTSSSFTLDDQSDDKVVPFHVTPLHSRGRAVQLGPMISSILERHDYPDPVSKLLGEVIVLGALLGSSIKFNGRFTIQTQTDGPVSLLVVDFKTPGSIRAYADFDEVKLQQSLDDNKIFSTDLLGKGIMAMTIDQGKNTQLYQGIVELNGDSLEQVARRYFLQSEQIPTTVRLAVSQTLTPLDNEEGSSKGWRAGGMLVQFLPESDEQLTVRDISGGDSPDGYEENEQEQASPDASQERDDLWIEASALVETASDEELSDLQLSSHRLLYRLFHEHGVHVYDSVEMLDECSCSRDKIINVLKSVSSEELESSWAEGVITSNCEFCNASYQIERSDLS